MTYLVTSKTNDASGVVTLSSKRKITTYIWRARCGFDWESFARASPPQRTHGWG